MSSSLGIMGSCANTGQEIVLHEKAASEKTKKNCSTTKTDISPLHQASMNVFRKYAAVMGGVSERLGLSFRDAPAVAVKSVMFSPVKDDVLQGLFQMLEKDPTLFITPATEDVCADIPTLRMDEDGQVHVIQD
ncbi:MAG: hypothetical protein HN411_05975 [Waddliaceae bacterium]|mgnify:CR=1 FL=1|jgi:hypothetical protein|nr:hypothetical protein [Waddliaceae bacterium]MBT3579418.1 hypothetical protein [Waddliaceae bacterium]MBT4444954.1 hypothetical protein [Waddliaceae bacterium]MBT6928251.1 hypothetical protein [Waddliaceae bacterium]MBT7265130.1 hypothetical protein [Waddliaceae bacterium]